MKSSLLKQEIKNNSRGYLDWLHQQTLITVPPNDRILNRDFQFNTRYRYLNFHPGIMGQARDLLLGRVDRQYHGTSSDIAVHDYIGHIASSQALCWNIVLPMKKHDNFSPLFDALADAFKAGGLDSLFDFGIETTAVLELNVGEDLGEGRLATSIDLYLRTADGKVCAIEFKLSEPDFGTCKLFGTKKCDGVYGSQNNAELNGEYLCYLSKIHRRYWQVGGQYNLLDPTKLNDPCPLNKFYQALRNLMVAKKRARETLGEEIRGVFVLAADDRNDAFWGFENHFDDLKAYLCQIRGQDVPDVLRISTQDIVRRFSGSLEAYKEYFAVKYGYSL